MSMCVCCLLDCLHLCLRKEAGDITSRRSSFLVLSRGAVDETTLPLEDYFGMDSQFELDKERYVMSIICRRRVFTLAFDNQTILKSWRDFISIHLGEGACIAVMCQTYAVPAGQCCWPTKPVSLLEFCFIFAIYLPIILVLENAGMYEFSVSVTGRLVDDICPSGISLSDK